MATQTFNLTLCAKRPNELYKVRERVTEFIDQQRGIRVTSCGRSCLDPSLAEIEFRAPSYERASALVAELHDRFADTCEIESDDLD
jgi:hypothetical protein